MYSGARIENIGTGITRYGHAALLGGMGALKFSDYAANNIKPQVANSPLTSGLCRRIGMRGTSRLIGTAELAIASLLAFPPRRSRLSALGSVLAIGMFGVTLSFLFSGPAWRRRRGPEPAAEGSAPHGPAVTAGRPTGRGDGENISTRISADEPAL